MPDPTDADRLAWLRSLPEVVDPQPAVSYEPESKHLPPVLMALQLDLTAFRDGMRALGEAAGRAATGMGTWAQGLRDLVQAVAWAPLDRSPSRSARRDAGPLTRAERVDRRANRRRQLRQLRQQDRTNRLLMLGAYRDWQHWTPQPGSPSWDQAVQDSHARLWAATPGTSYELDGMDVL